MTPESAINLLILESEWAQRTFSDGARSPYEFNRYQAIVTVLTDLLERVEKLEGKKENEE